MQRPMSNNIDLAYFNFLKLERHWQGIIPVEGLVLNDVSPGLYNMHCLPLKLIGSDGAPV